MTILGIETATITGGLAIVKDRKLLAQLSLNVQVTHSERLLPGLQYLLLQANLKTADMDVMAVSIGPGSFTGLRVGLGIAKGLAFASGKPIIPVPTLEAFAWNFPFSAYPVCPLLDARKKELYGALFVWDDRQASFQRIIPEGVMSPNEWAELIKDKSTTKVVLAGEGALLYRNEIKKVLGENALFAEGTAGSPRPANVAFLGQKIAETGLIPPNPAGITPFYIRKSEAELKRIG